MEGYLKIEAVENGVSVRTKLKDVSIMDKAIMLDAMFDALDIDAGDPTEISMFCALAAVVNHMGGRTKVDMGAIKEAAEKMEQKEGES